MAANRGGGDGIPPPPPPDGGAVGGGAGAVGGAAAPVGGGAAGGAVGGGAGAPGAPAPGPAVAANLIAMQPLQLQALANMMRGPSTKLRRMTNATPEAWLEYRRHFIKIAQLQNWDDPRCRQELAAGVQEKAGNAVADIDVMAPGLTIDNVLELYQQRFLPAAAGTTARTNYQTAKQLPTETVREYHTRVRELFFLAYPNGIINDANHAMDIFINGLYNPTVHFCVASQHIATFTDALPPAERAETANKKNQKTPGIHAVAPRPNFNAQPNSLAPPGSGNCYFCADVFKVQNPHLKNQCPYFKAANRLFQSHRRSGSNSNSTASSASRASNSRRSNNSNRRNVNAVDSADQHENDSDNDSEETGN